MSSDPMPAELIAYTRDLFAPEDATLRALTRAAQEFGMPLDWEISPDVGRLFQVLCRAVGARRVVEFGTLAGHSALWLARALPDTGKVISIEFNPEYARFAREQLSANRIGTQNRGAGGRGLRHAGPAGTGGARAGTVRCVFLDADKARYPEFLEWSARVLRPGGLLLADNVLRSSSWNGQLSSIPTADDARILAIREFNQRLAIRSPLYCHADSHAGRHRGSDFSSVKSIGG